MASKSKKRRRVLGASCILAALIIAGSSFAWFTSKDEVTNRLTASADYNVSIIENFAPPKQWVPGQTVTKEEAVVNTGNVDAFVHQTISSVLNIAVEVPTTTAPDSVDQDGYISLNTTEAGTLEAGSYLAYAPDGVVKGDKVISVIPDTEGSEKLTDFNPTKTGLYIFRRAVVKNNSEPAGDETYEYVGYYYVAPTAEQAQEGKTGTYYKLHDIVKESLVLEKNGNGNLASAPIVTYAKETKITQNKAPMVYEAAVTTGDEDKRHGDRLVISFDKNAEQATTSLTEDAFNKYRDYLDKLQGKTTWDVGESTTTPKAKDPANKTGLTDFDRFAQDANESSATPLDSYSNYSLARLEDRKTETNDAVKAASPKTGEEVDWGTVYNNAKADRKTINEGVKAAQALRSLRTEVEGLIGISNDVATPGLYQNKNYTADNTFHYSATAESMSPADGEGEDAAVKLMTPTAKKGGGESTDDITYDGGTGKLFIMTADTMDQARFATYASDGVKWNVVTKPYANGTSETSQLKQAWDAYENAVKARKLLEAKIKICKDVAKDGSTTSVARITKGDGTGSVEVGEYKAWLEEQLATAQANEAAAKATYDAQQKAVKDKIAEINGYQDKVNKANEVDSKQASVTVNGEEYNAVYAGDKENASSYPSETTGPHAGYRSVVNNETNEGQVDSLDEDVLEAYLKAVYGIALKDKDNASEYWDGRTYMAQPTYSPTVTKDTIDGNLTSVDGVISWKDTVTDVDKITDTNDKTNVGNSPYYEDKKVGFMKDYRQTEVDNAKALYEKAVAAKDGQEAVDASAGIVKIYVNLANIGNGADEKTWQYVPEAATGVNVGKDFNFYYTSILPSGETSSLLIKSLEFDKDVKQDAFRKVDLDLNVQSESAQVVYNGDVIEATAANATITGAKTTADSYATVNGPVQWVARTDTTPTTEEITDKDPNPKADANVTP